MSQIEPYAADNLLQDIRRLIDDTRTTVATTINASLTILYWQIGRRINADMLEGERAPYGEQIVARLAEQLTLEYGQSFAEKNLRRMVQFASVYPDEQIVVSLIRHLSWTHFLALLPLKDPLQRDFYAEMCRLERWSVRTLRQKISSMLYERTALSKKPETLIRQELDTLRAEELPLGLILCAEGAHETIELLRLDTAGIRVAEYLTELPPKEILARKLHATMHHARARLAQREQGDV